MSNENELIYCEISGGVVYGELRFDRSTIYMGEIYKGKANGFGRLYCGHKLSYEGIWKDNKLQSGRGFYTTGGIDYEGGFDDEYKPHGLVKDFDAYGQLRQIAHYEHGVVKELYKAWDNEGNIIFEQGEWLK